MNNLSPTRAATIVTADGLNLAYEDWGAGAPIVLVHSWALHSAMWRQQIPALTEAGFRCIAFDRRGHGRSSGNGHGYDIDTLADDLAAVLDQLDLHGVTLVAHSMGACEVTRYLTRHGSARVARVVMLAPVTPFLIKTPDNPLGLDRAMFEATRAMWRQDFPKWVGDNAAPFFTPETSPETLAWGVRMIADCPVPIALATNLAFVDIDFRPELAAIGVPTLVIHGTVDQSAPLEITGQPTAALIPNAELVVLPGAPHGLFVTHADAVNRTIADFARG
jgi:pimeloyl-ACP methyl ester carboxylesterase